MRYLESVETLEVPEGGTYDFLSSGIFPKRMDRKNGKVEPGVTIEDRARGGNHEEGYGTNDCGKNAALRGEERKN
jgi:hypothetical protein